jgi:hypothetical protein
MDTIADVLLLHAVQAWCDDCGSEQLLVPADGDGAGLCCTVCDAAVFIVPEDETAPARLRHTA